MTQPDIVAQVNAKLLEKLGASLSADLKPLVEKYGATLLSLGEARLADWVRRARGADPISAYAEIVTSLPSEDLVLQWDAVAAEWQLANAANALENAARLAAINSVVSGLLTIALAHV